MEPVLQQEVVPVPKKAKHEKTVHPAIQYLGENQKGVCILVDYPNDVHLPDSQLNFLTSILQACKLNLGDVAIVNCHRQQVSVPLLVKQLLCSKLLVLGNAAPLSGLQHLPAFSIQVENDCQILCSPAAENLNQQGAEGKLLKGKLWTCLKEMFGV